MAWAVLEARKPRDVRLLRTVQLWRSARRDAAVRLVTACGTHDFYVPFLALTLWTGAAWLGQSLILVLGLVIPLANALKTASRCVRPTAADGVWVGGHAGDRDFSFPSTHAAAGVALPLAALLAAVRHGGGPEVLSLPLLLLAAAWALAMAASRLYLAVHWPADVAAGLLLGVVVAVLLHLVHAPMLLWVVAEPHMPLHLLAATVLFFALAHADAPPLKTLGESASLAGAAAGTLLGMRFWAADEFYSGGVVSAFPFPQPLAEMLAHGPSLHMLGLLVFVWGSGLLVLVLVLTLGKYVFLFAYTAVAFTLRLPYYPYGALEKIEATPDQFAAQPEKYLAPNMLGRRFRMDTLVRFSTYAAMTTIACYVVPAAFCHWFGTFGGL